MITLAFTIVALIEYNYHYKGTSAILSQVLDLHFNLFVNIKSV